jgi:hypothetical protein
MSQNKDFWLLVALSFAIVGVLTLGIYTSPTFTQKQNYINSLVIFIEILFVASVTLLVLWHGFRHFAIMLTIIFAAIISLFGIQAALIALLFTYITWGFAFCIELLLAHNEVTSAIEWFKKHYTPKIFTIEFKVFYPLLKLMHILLEIIPSIIYKEPTLDFNPKQLQKAMLNELKKHHN